MQQFLGTKSQIPRYAVAMKQETPTPADRLRALLRVYALALLLAMFISALHADSLRARRLLEVVPGMGKGYPREETSGYSRRPRSHFWSFRCHITETWIWAAFFWKSGHMTSFGDGWYFACVSHTALGYGDVVLQKPWRSLRPICAINGLLTFGCSTAALFLVLQRVWHHKLYALV